MPKFDVVISDKAIAEKLLEFERRILRGTPDLTEDDLLYLNHIRIICGMEKRTAYKIRIDCILECALKFAEEYAKLTSPVTSEEPSKKQMVTEWPYMPSGITQSMIHPNGLLLSDDEISRAMAVFRKNYGLTRIAKKYWKYYKGSNGEPLSVRVIKVEDSRGSLNDLSGVPHVGGKRYKYYAQRRTAIGKGSYGKVHLMQDLETELITEELSKTQVTVTDQDEKTAKAELQVMRELGGQGEGYAYCKIEKVNNSYQLVHRYAFLMKHEGEMTLEKYLEVHNNLSLAARFKLSLGLIAATSKDSQKYTHGDLSLGNYAVNLKTDVPSVIDRGFSTKRNSTPNTGTCLYAPPEMRRLIPEPDLSNTDTIDIFSLGKILSIVLRLAVYDNTTITLMNKLQQDCSKPPYKNDVPLKNKLLVKIFQLADEGITLVEPDSTIASIFPDRVTQAEVVLMLQKMMDPDPRQRPSYDEVRLFFEEISHDYIQALDKIRRIAIVDVRWYKQASETEKQKMIEGLKQADEVWAFNPNEALTTYELMMVHQELLQKGVPAGEKLITTSEEELGEAISEIESKEPNELRGYFYFTAKDNESVPFEIAYDNGKIHVINTDFVLIPIPYRYVMRVMLDNDVVSMPKYESVIREDLSIQLKKLQKEVQSVLRKELSRLNTRQKPSKFSSDDLKDIRIVVIRACIEKLDRDAQELGPKFTISHIENALKDAQDAIRKARGILRDLTITEALINALIEKIQKKEQKTIISKCPSTMYSRVGRPGSGTVRVGRAGSGTVEPIKAGKSK